MGDPTLSGQHFPFLWNRPFLRYAGGKSLAGFRLRFTLGGMQASPNELYHETIEEAAQRRMRRYYRMALYGFVIISGFYLLSGVLGFVLAAAELVGPPPEAEIPTAPPVARLAGAVIVILLGVPGLIVFLRRREPVALRILKIGGVVLLALHTLMAALSLEAPRTITVFLLFVAILGMWVTLVAFHPRTLAIQQQSK